MVQQIPPTARLARDNKIPVVFICRVNSLNSGSVLNIGNGPLSDPSVYIEAKGRKAAHQFLMRPKAAKWLIIVWRGLFPEFGKHLEFSEFTLSFFNHTQGISLTGYVRHDAYRMLIF